MSRTTGSGPAPEPHWQSLLPVARELERWVNALPAVPFEARESRERPSGQQRQDETELAAKLRRLHGCTVTDDLQGLQTTLVLAGIEVTSERGLAGACREWVAKIRHEALKGALKIK